jgi:aspartate dehydrogenase
MPRIGIIGCGNIAGLIAAHGEDYAEIAACFDIDPPRMQAFGRRTNAQVSGDIETLLACDFPVLVEAASIQAVRDHLLPALFCGKDVVVLSVGALLDKAFQDEVRAEALRLGRRVYVPSGAVFGLDNLKVARVAPLDRLVLRTTKHPRALGLSPEESRRCLFRGPATEAVRQFPKNINVSAAIGLATGIEPDVELWADPDASSNQHEIEASGAFGSVSIRADNLPSPDNPATSYLAALSVLTLLKDLDDPLQVGT